MTILLRSRFAGLIYLLLGGIEGVGAAILLLSIAPDPNHAVLGGYSAARLTMLAIAFSGAAVFFVLSVAWLKYARFIELLGAALRWGEKPFRRMAAVMTPLATGMLLGFAINALMAGRIPACQAASFRLAPLVVWAALVCFQTGLFLPLVVPGWIQTRGLGHLQVGTAAGLAVAGLLVTGWAILAAAGLGFDVSVGDWIQGPNPPVFFSQVLLVVAALVGMVFLLPRLIKLRKIDLLLALGIWLLAVVIWEATPYNSSFFVTRPLPPNFEPYPYSDAHDFIITGQTLLIGEGYAGRSLILRPLHVLMLTIYHIIAGQNYDRVVAVQVLVLALIPLLIYSIGQKVHSRLGGAAAALLLILRERNSMLISGMIPGGNTHVKLLMTELPTILGMVILIVILLRWFENPRRRGLAPLAAGGVIGAMGLIRSPALALMPVAAIFMILWALPKIRTGARAVVLMGLGVLLFISPWLGRNYLLTGHFELEVAPSYSHYYEALLITGIDAPQLPGESGHEFNARMTKTIRDYVFSNPLKVVKFASEHFFHNEINSTLTLPISPDFRGMVEYVKDNILWSGGKFQPEAPLETALLLTNIGIAGIGIGAAFKRKRGLILVPLMVRFGYNLTLSMGRRSGGRYFMPGDWVTLFVFGLGLAELVIWAAALLRAPGSGLFTSPAVSSDPDRSLSKRKPLQSLLLAGAAILAGGMLLPAAEWVVPPRYKDLSPMELAGMLEERQPGNANGNLVLPLKDLAAKQGIQSFWGRGLYPRYLSPGESLRSYEVLSDQARLRFEVIGPQRGEVILQGIETPAYFPNASDVAVFGCPAGTYLDAWLVIVQDKEGDHYYWRSPLPAGSGCPPP